MFTVVPDSKLSVKDEPAGTVKPFTLTVVHLTAEDTSEREYIVPVQSLDRGSGPRAARVQPTCNATARAAYKVISAPNMML